jgi:hypothetical protein
MFRVPPSSEIVLITLPLQITFMGIIIFECFSSGYEDQPASSDSPPTRDKLHSECKTRYRRALAREKRAWATDLATTAMLETDCKFIVVVRSHNIVICYCYSARSSHGTPPVTRRRDTTWGEVEGYCRLYYET